VYNFLDWQTIPCYIEKMPKRIEAHAILVPGPLSNGPVYDKAATALRELGVMTSVHNVPWNSTAITVDMARAPIQTAIAADRAMPLRRPLFLIGAEVAGPLVGLEALEDPHVSGAVLLSPPGSVPIDGRVRTSALAYEETVATFARRFAVTPDTARTKIAVMAPEDSTLIASYLPGARHETFQPGDSQTVYGGIEHLLTTGSELKKLAHVMRFF
jgi:hypothetical protein